MLRLFWGKFLHLEFVVARGGALGTQCRLLVQLSLSVYCKNDCGDDCDNERDNIRDDLHGSKMMVSIFDVSKCPYKTATADKYKES